MNPALPNRKWYYVYLLRSSKTQWIYIGCTSSKTQWIYIGCTNGLENRLKEHNEGKVYSTKRMLPVELVYYEAYKSKDIAYKREKNLKSYGSGLAGLKLRLGIKKKGRAG